VPLSRQDAQTSISARPAPRLAPMTTCLMRFRVDRRRPSWSGVTDDPGLLPFSCFKSVGAGPCANGQGNWSSSSLGDKARWTSFADSAIGGEGSRVKNGHRCLLHSIRRLDLVLHFEDAVPILIATAAWLRLHPLICVHACMMQSYPPMCMHEGNFKSPDLHQICSYTVSQTEPCVAYFY
jgi:hypothetical protein